MKAALTDQILIRKGKIWTAKRRTDHEAIFRVSASRIFSAVGLIVSAEEDLAVVIASVVAVDLAAIVLVAVAADLADLAAEDFEVVAGDKNKDLN